MELRVIGCGVTISIAAIGLAATQICHAQIYAESLPLDHPAIRYLQDPLDDPVVRLSKRLEHGQVKLQFREGGLGYLPSLIEQLGVNPDSQALVFSKTSFQAAKISPRNPRAIYFSDDVAIGFVPGGEGLEIAALDPRQGIVFYTMDARKPEFTRRENCLQCHQGPATMGVPGIFIGSVFPNADGAPSHSGAIITDHRTPFADRWGGWYVDSKRGEQRDRANAAASDPAEPETLEILPRINTSRYLMPSSDIVALMTFEHQTQMVNLIIRLGWEARMGVPQTVLDHDIRAAVEYLLFADEVPLREPVEGVSSFTKTFPDRGPRDRQGRSLRDFDLQRRLFRYPLSYLIYSEAFDALPDAVREPVYRQLYAILTNLESSQKFASLTKDDRRAILEILRETKPNLPAYWRDSD